MIDETKIFISFQSARGVVEYEIPRAVNVSVEPIYLPPERVDPYTIASTNVLDLLSINFRPLADEETGEQYRMFIPDRMLPETRLNQLLDRKIKLQQELDILDAKIARRT